MNRAGTPPTMANGGTVLVTTAPAAMKAPSPMSWPHTMVALAPMLAPRPPPGTSDAIISWLR